MTTSEEGGDEGGESNRSSVVSTVQSYGVGVNPSKVSLALSDASFVTAVQQPLSSQTTHSVAMPRSEGDPFGSEAEVGVLLNARGSVKGVDRSSTDELELNARMARSLSGDDL